MLPLSSLLILLLLVCSALSCDFKRPRTNVKEELIGSCVKNQSCPTASLSSSFALSLLRLSSSPSESFVLSPFSLGSALSIVHDGASGQTKEELTNLLLPGCTSTDVISHYSSLVYSLQNQHIDDSFNSANRLYEGVRLRINKDSTGGWNTSANQVRPECDIDVCFNSANRLYLEDKFVVKKQYLEHIAQYYNVEVEKFKPEEKEKATDRMNKFVHETTNGRISDIVTPDDINDETSAVLINAIDFFGKWQKPFSAESNKIGRFSGVNGDREIIFMKQYDLDFAVNLDNEFGTALLMPYKNSDFKFFFLMPNEDLSFENMRNELTGGKLVDIILKATKKNVYSLKVPKFEIKSELDGIDLLSRMGVSTMLNDDEADFSKISDTPIKISKIVHKAVIKINEEGTEASAVSGFNWRRLSRRIDPIKIKFDLPFLYGVIRNTDILFLGQLV